MDPGGHLASICGLCVPLPKALLVTGIERVPWREAMARDGLLRPCLWRGRQSTCDEKTS
jgi:hypothetical protein